MKVQLKPMLATLAVSGLVSMPVIANTDTDNMARINAQIASLQKEAQSLNNKLGKKQKASHKKVAHKKHHESTTTTTTKTTATTARDREFAEFIRRERQYLPFDLDVPGQAFVSTGPYVGVPIQYSGSNLIVNSPSVNTDVQLLGIRKSIIEHLDAMGGEIVKEPYHSHLLLSGLVEGLANYTNIGGQPSTTDLNVSTVSLDAFFIGPSEWTLGFIEFNYNPSTPANSVFTSTSNYRTANSTVFINKAFITIGDFDKSPYYGSLGQFYVPFGTYSSVMLSDPFTKTLGRTKERALLIGMQQQSDNAFYGSAFIFRGDSHAASVSKVNNGGVNVGVRYKCGGLVHGDLGGGVMGNIADSGGMQVGNGFQSAEQLVHRVPAYNLRAVVSPLSHFDFIGEFVGTTTRFNPQDMSFNNKGAKPWALELEGAYSFYILDERPTSIGIGYGQSNQALALGIPLNRIGIEMTTSLWRNTLQSIELRSDKEYANSNVASSAGGAVSTPESGKHDSAITAEFDYYF